MGKTTTSVSIEHDITKRFRDKYKDRSFSEYVESLVSKDLAEKLSIEEIDSKLKEAHEEVRYLEDKLSEAINNLEIETDIRANTEKERLKNIKFEKQQQLNQYIERFKGFPEINKIIDDYKMTSNILFNNKYMVEQIENLRKKYGVRIGIVQLRDVIISLSGSVAAVRDQSSQVPSQADNA